MARLLAQAGVAAQVTVERLEAMRGSGAVLVATGYDGLSGLAVVHWCPVLHEARLAATLSALVVDADARRNGIGRLLLKAASQAARAVGCGTLTLVANDGVAGEGAASFCRAAGFVAQGEAWQRPLRRRGGE